MTSRTVLGIVERRLLLNSTRPEPFDRRTCKPDCRYLVHYPNFGGHFNCALPSSTGKFHESVLARANHGELERTRSCKKRFK